MQQIERYGVIALVFLLVTIVAVSFWGDGKSPGFWSRLTGRVKKDEVAKVDPSMTAPIATAEQALGGGAPLTTPTNAIGTLDPLQAQPALGAATTPVDLATQPAATPIGAPATEADPFAQLSMQVPQQPVASPIVGGQPNVAPLAPITAPIIASGEIAPAPAGREYVVQRGDSLALIARKLLGSEQRWSEIQALNPGVSAKSLKVGAKLVLPAGAQVASTKPSHDETSKKAKASKPASTLAASSPKKSSSTSTYTIRRGDTLNAIAEKRLGGKQHVKDILALNPGLDPRRLVVGKSIRMPQSSSASDSERDRGVIVADAKPASSDKSAVHVDRPRVR